MNFQIKLFSWQDVGNHLIILARGPMDAAAFTRLFHDIKATTQNLSECKVLVDLSDSTYQVDGTEIEALAAALQANHWPRGNRIAIVSTVETAGYHRLYFLRTELIARGLAIEIFRNSRVALDWLALAG